MSFNKTQFGNGNSEEKGKGAAKYVTKSVEDNGIYYGLQRVGLI
jgi:hydroxymethylpyrimidine pyrophosphatase-like HAD family hydrolase